MSLMKQPVVPAKGNNNKEADQGLRRGGLSSPMKQDTSGKGGKKQSG